MGVGVAGPGCGESAWCGGGVVVRTCSAFLERGRPSENVRILLASLRSEMLRTQPGPSGSAEGVRMGWK